MHRAQLCSLHRDDFSDNPEKVGKENLQAESSHGACAMPGKSGLTAPHVTWRTGRASCLIRLA
jgi:hypothetical protein